jgi:two-component system nitrogen regulation response regulator NtrX
MAPGPVLTLRDVPPPVGSSPAGPGASSPLIRAGYDHAALKDARAEFEREFITRKLKENGGNVSKTADAISVERSNLHRKIKALGIEVED